MTEIKVRLYKDGVFPINEELAGLVPMASEAEQASLTYDIGTNGQQEPIVLWKGDIVDGRCRQLACRLAKAHIMYRELDDSLTEDEVKVYVKSVNTRRNLTHTQKVMSACRASLVVGAPKIVDVAKSWGIGDKILKNARYIAKHRPEMVDTLFNGGSVKIVSTEGKEIDSNKVSTIYAALKRAEENVLEDDSYGWEEDSYIKTQKGKEWYYEQLKDINDIRTKMLIAELANYKYTLKD